MSVTYKISTQIILYLIFLIVIFPLPVTSNVIAIGTLVGIALIEKRYWNSL
jgi:hypothetical protein